MPAGTKRGASAQAPFLPRPQTPTLTNPEMAAAPSDLRPTAPQTPVARAKEFLPPCPAQPRQLLTAATEAFSGFVFNSN